MRDAMSCEETRSGFLEDSLTREIGRLGVPGLSVAVVKGDGVCWARGFGVADIATGTPATAETVYMWFSMTKIVTATAILQLKDQGKLRLDDLVADYIPYFPRSASPVKVTIRHLLNHSSGLANPIPIRWVHSVAREGPNPDAFLEMLLAKHRKLKSSPGEKASYSNIGYVALGAVVAAASAMTYKDYVLKRILKPLKMDQTSFNYTPEMVGNAATGYQKRWSMMALLLPFMRIPKGVTDGKIGGYVAFNRFYLDGSSYGGLIGPVKDAARLVQAHLNPGLVDGVQVLSPDSTAAMQRISARGSELDVGLGWFRRHSEGAENSSYLEHLGGGAGFFNDMRIYPEQSLGVVVMGNSTKYDIERVIEIVRSVNWN
jgi:CubicO group peptidase (beta-lactamase class C family)